MPSIRQRGLIPCAKPRALSGLPDHIALSQTDGIPVVWLTTVPNEWHGARLSVRLEANSSRLQRFLPWARKFNPHIEVTAADATANAIANDIRMEPDCWFVYLGTIPPERIEEAVPEAVWAA